ncbi:Haloacetate dehalogenase H-1 [bacterium HR40]|nr:Haloacetate dehalogenase H-1 [bacterium HR40]
MRERFVGFEARSLPASAGAIAYRIGGSGPPLFLLHGYPETHLMWHRVAPLLASSFTVVCPDLRGYGDSAKPPTTPDHEPYSKRAMASDVLALADHLGFRTFAACGHDRGARVLHRLCLDQPERVVRAALLDIVPTLTLFEKTDQAIASGYFHWFFLSQPAPLPERLIGGNPRFWLEWILGRWAARPVAEVFPADVFDAYLRAFSEPATIHATCEDYRAGATIDLEHDRADRHRRIGCPLLVLWGATGLIARHFDVLACWREKAAGSVEGRALSCGHFLPEEAAEETALELLRFFRA